MHFHVGSSFHVIPNMFLKVSIITNFISIAILVHLFRIPLEELVIWHNGPLCPMSA